MISIIIDLTELFFFSAVVRLMHVVIVACNLSRVERLLFFLKYSMNVNWITLGSNYKNIKWVLSDVYYGIIALSLSFFFQLIDFHLIFSPFPFTVTWVSCVIMQVTFLFYWTHGILQNSGVSISTDDPRNASATLLRAVAYLFLQKRSNKF